MFSLVEISNTKVLMSVDFGMFAYHVPGVPKKCSLIRRAPISLRNIFSGTPCIESLLSIRLMVLCRKKFLREDRDRIYASGYGKFFILILFGNSFKQCMPQYILCLPIIQECMLTQKHRCKQNIQC